MSSNAAIQPKISMVWAGMHEEGIRLELSCNVHNKDHYFASFVADEITENLFLELFVAGQSIRVPIETFETAIAEAKKDVHSESWYDRQNANGT